MRSDSLKKDSWPEKSNQESLSGIRVMSTMTTACLGEGVAGSFWDDWVDIHLAKE
jgi:hypothetical protein